MPIKQEAGTTLIQLLLLTSYYKKVFFHNFCSILKKRNVIAAQNSIDFLRIKFKDFYKSAIIDYQNAPFPVGLMILFFGNEVERKSFIHSISCKHHRKIKKSITMLCFRKTLNLYSKIVKLVLCQILNISETRAENEMIYSLVRARMNTSCFQGPYVTAQQELL